jgi:hypothetical protein
MTWNTSSGIRILKGNEAKLFINVFLYMKDMADSREYYHYIDQNCEFNNLNTNQRNIIYEEIIKGLFFKTESCIHLNQYNEAAIYSVFETLTDGLDDIGIFENVWGRDVMDLYNEKWPVGEDEDFEDDRPYMGCMDKDKWDMAIAFLRERILHDEDFTKTYLINLRISYPEMYETLCEKNGIDSTYFEIREIEDRDNSSELYDLVSEIETGLRLTKFQLKIKSWYKKRNEKARIIQKACHNWLWNPVTKDLKLGINLRIGIESIKGEKLMYISELSI